MSFVIYDSNTSYMLQNSQSATILFGPFLSETDGKTPMTSLSIGQSNVRLSKNDGDFAAKNDSGSATHQSNGWYNITIDGTDTNTEGTLLIAVHVAGALPVWQEYQVNLNVAP